VNDRGFPKKQEVRGEKGSRGLSGERPLDKIGLVIETGLGGRNRKGVRREGAAGASLTKSKVGGCPLKKLNTVKPGREIREGRRQT